MYTFLNVSMPFQVDQGQRGHQVVAFHCYETVQLTRNVSFYAANCWSFRKTFSNAFFVITKTIFKVKLVFFTIFESASLSRDLKKNNIYRTTSFKSKRLEAPGQNSLLMFLKSRVRIQPTRGLYHKTFYGIIYGFS